MRLPRFFSPRRRSFADYCAARRRLGWQGEHVAERVLCEYGMDFLCRNFRHGHGEIDLIFRDDVELCFVEVKTRSYKKGIQPAEAVGTEKQKQIIKAARGYLKRIGSPKIQCRFDIVEVLFEHSAVKSVNYMPGAYLPDRPLV